MGLAVPSFSVPREVHPASSLPRSRASHACCILKLSPGSQAHPHLSLPSALAAGAPPAWPLQTHPETTSSRRRSLWVVPTLSPPLPNTHEETISSPPTKSPLLTAKRFHISLRSTRSARHNTGLPYQLMKREGHLWQGATGQSESLGSAQLTSDPEGSRR